MSDEFWTSEEGAEFAQAERDDAAAEQVAEDQFPEGWTDVGATDEPVQFSPYITIGPAKLFTQPVESPIFEAIDRASEDRTPVIETKISPGDAFTRFREAVMKATETFSGLVTPDTGDQTHAAWKHEMLEQIYGPMKRQRQQVALMGTGYRRHAHPGPLNELQPAGSGGPFLSQAEHARRRRLYSERLRRDRRRRRAGRPPILRSSAFTMLIPRAQIKITEAGPETMGMEIVTHPWVPDDQVYVVDPSILDGYRFTEPKTFMQDPGRSRFADQAEIYQSMRARYGSPMGLMHRATNYLIQADAGMRQSLSGWNGPVIIAIDETADWAPEHTADVDTWMNEGGADRG